jgi:hypothetical protein
MGNGYDFLRQREEQAALVKGLQDRQKTETDAVNKACIEELTQEIPEVENFPKYPAPALV